MSLHTSNFSFENRRYWVYLPRILVIEAKVNPRWDCTTGFRADMIAPPHNLAHARQLGTFNRIFFPVTQCYVPLCMSGQDSATIKGHLNPLSAISTTLIPPAWLPEKLIFCFYWQMRFSNKWKQDWFSSPIFVILQQYNGS